MKQFKVLLPSVAEAREFVAAAERCDFDIDIYYNRVIIDGKSILGVLSLDLSQVLTVEFRGEDLAFEAFLAEKAPGGCSAP